MEEYQQSQQNDNVSYPQQGGVSGTPLLHADPSLIRWLQEPRDIVNELRIRLKGFEYDEDQRRFVLRYKPLLNDDGVNEISTVIRGHLNKTVQLSNFNEKEVNRMAREATIAAIICIYYNWARFGVHSDQILDKLQKGISEGSIRNVKLVYCENGIVFAVNEYSILRRMMPKPDIASYNEIILLVDHLVFASLKKAMNGGERLFLTKTISENVSKIQSERPGGEKKKSWWSKLRL